MKTIGIDTNCLVTYRTGREPGYEEIEVFVENLYKLIGIEYQLMTDELFVMKKLKNKAFISAVVSTENPAPWRL